MILLDTHVLVWLDEGSNRLGVKTRDIIDEALSEERLLVAAISFWEITILVEKNRLEIKMDLQNWRRELLEKGLQEIAMHGALGIQAGQLPGFHGDPADRIIVASALSITATLVTADEKILAWQGLSGKQDARI
ncbi:MAG: type II toxin-antitoxin system VapC family toxin [Deltaproteobacteria bacterium]|nr:type II toxin-antitoxin system VapC family toxin [Candidatus Tharpella aukensis]